MPTALGQGPVERTTPFCVLPTRAMENGLFVLYSNLAGDTYCDELGGRMRFCGRSAILGPDGTDLARAHAYVTTAGSIGASAISRY